MSDRFGPRALGADASKYSVAQSQRLAELAAVSGNALDGLLDQMRLAIKLPKLEYHFDRHGSKLGAATPEEYQRIFVEFMRTGVFRYFTAYQPRYKSRMWYMVDMDTARVAQYNESKQTPWSFYAVDSIEDFLRWGRGWWVEVIATSTGFEFEALK